jgi:NadR type nicotinamide-nucleotide adenylyltransferase
LIRVCFHGAESTGKSTLIARLAAQGGWPSVPEYGRTWAEEHGTDFAMADLLAIARGQDAAMRAASARAPDILLLDTDPLMTAAWAEMLFGKVPDELLAFEKAELYLLFMPDVPWLADGTRFFGSDAERARFAGVCEEMLLRVRAPYRRIAGDWSARERAAREAIAAISGGPRGPAARG